MAYPEMKFCKKCTKTQGKDVYHPNTSAYFFLNGGKLRKCKAFYGPYEAHRKKEATEKAKREKQLDQRAPTE